MLLRSMQVPFYPEPPTPIRPGQASTDVERTTVWVNHSSIPCHRRRAAVDWMYTVVAGRSMHASIEYDGHNHLGFSSPPFHGQQQRAASPLPCRPNHGEAGDERHGMTWEGYLMHGTKVQPQAQTKCMYVQLYRWGEPIVHAPCDFCCTWAIRFSNTVLNISTGVTF
jgi:hypothetical protein